MRPITALVFLAASALACALVVAAAATHVETRRSPVSLSGPVPRKVSLPVSISALDADPVGSTVVVARLGDRTVAIVADADDQAVVTIDPRSGAVLGRFALGGTPAQILVAREGALFVAVRDRARVAVLEPSLPEGELRERASVATDDEPFGLAETRDGTVLVTCALAHSLQGFRAGDLSALYQIDLPREPRAVVPSSRYKRAYVAHLAAPLLSVVDLSAAQRGYATFATTQAAALPSVEGLMAGWEDRGKWASILNQEAESMIALIGSRRSSAAQGFAIAAYGDVIVAPHVRALPGETAIRTISSYGSGGSHPAEFGAAALVADAASPRLFFRSGPSCLLPRAAVFTGWGSYLVACADGDEIEEVLPSAEPPRPPPFARRWLSWRVGSGITGLAYDPVDNRAVAWAQSDRILGVLSLDRLGPVEPSTYGVAAVGPARYHDAAVSLGRRLFHSSHDSRIARDGRACASCHPDGLDDGLVWATPDGPRQTPTLRGRVAGTAPYGWLGRRQTLTEHLGQTIERLGGTGLAERDVQALVAYVTSMQAPGRAPSHDGGQGRAVFDLHCGYCHEPAGGFTDGDRHDVRSRTGGDVAAAFDTPSLRFVADTAPYFHDGRYATLAQVLDRTEGRMWSAPPGGLSPGDRAALEAYLSTL
jgi:mono/diheme cytochrome c family protein